MLTPTAEREELRAVMRQLFATHSSESRVRSFLTTDSGYDTATWKMLAEQVGVQSLAIPEEYGGAGFGFAELAVVIEESGRALVCAPLLSTCVLATSALLLADDDAAARRHLPGIAAGTTVATTALPTQNGPAVDEAVSVRATVSGETTTLTGTAEFVLDGADADLIIVPAHTEHGLSLFTVSATDAGVAAQPLPTLDQTRNLATLTFDAAPAEPLGTPGKAAGYIAKITDVAASALAMEQVGGAAQVLESTVEYAKIREQFGRPIGSFQAIKHKLADMLVELESARSAAYYAAGAVDADADDLSLAASIAKAYCSEAFYHIAAESIQIHGGIGFTWEHPAHLYFKRARGSQTLLGSPGVHRERVAVLAGL